MLPDLILKTPREVMGYCHYIEIVLKVAAFRTEAKNPIPTASTLWKIRIFPSKNRFKNKKANS